MSGVERSLWLLHSTNDDPYTNSVPANALHCTSCLEHGGPKLDLSPEPLLRIAAAWWHELKNEFTTRCTFKTLVALDENARTMAGTRTSDRESAGFYTHICSVEQSPNDYIDTTGMTSKMVASFSKTRHCCRIAMACLQR